MAYFGWMIREKGLFELVRAIAKVPDVTVDMYGADTHPKDLLALKALITELGLVDRVTYWGMLPHDEVPAVISSYDAVIHPSHTESFGMVTAEAMSLGVPVIATREGFLWAIADSCLVPIETTTPESISSALYVALEQKRDILPAKGAAGKQYVTSNMSETSVMLAWHRLYDEMP